MPAGWRITVKRERVRMDGKGGSSEVPEGWRVKSLIDVCEQIADCSHSTPVWKDDGFIVLRTQNIKDGQISLSSPSFTDEAHYLERIGRAVPETGDIVVTREAPAGEIGIVPPNIKVCLGQRLVLVKPDKSKVSNKFVKFYLMSDLVQRNVFQLQANGSTVGNIRIPVLKSIPLFLPPLEEQHKIADILSAWDEAIEQQTRLLELKRERKRGLMQQLLTGKVRFKEFEGLEWDTRKLGDIAVASSGGTPTSTEPSYYGGGIPWVAIADITASGKHISRTEKTITQRGLDESSAKIFPTGTLLFAMYASIGKCAIAAVDLSCNQAILGIRPFSTVSTEFLYYFLASQELQYSLMGQQGTQKNLNAGMVKGFDVPLPTLKEQQKIAAVFSAADAELDALEAQLSALRTQKRGLMQQLLTGKTRVSLS